MASRVLTGTSPATDTLSLRQAYRATRMLYTMETPQPHPARLCRHPDHEHTEKPVYFSGTLSISAGKSFFSNAYRKTWTAMPYIRDAVTGIGCYGVNSAGRAQWGKFPSIHSDDKYVRMQFGDKQCVKLDAAYHRPIPQGLLTLVKVRTRWIRGNKELRSRFPHLLQKKSESKRLKTDRQSITTMLTNPIHTLAFIMVYATAASLAEVGRDQPKIRWSRAR